MTIVDDKDGVRWIFVVTEYNTPMMFRITPRERWKLEWRRQRLARRGIEPKPLCVGSLSTFLGVTFTDRGK